MKHVTVIGAGIIGLNCAWELHKRGVRVTLIDAHVPGRGASAINAGWVVPSMSGPVPAPGVIGQSLKWLLRPDSPFAIRPQFNGEFLHWLLRFTRACNARQYQRGLEAVAELNRGTMQHFDALRAEGIPFEMHTSGVLYAFESVAEMERELAHTEQLRPFGYPVPTPLVGAEVQAREPDLSTRVTAAYAVERERSIRPETLVAGLCQRLVREGVEILQETPVTGLEVQNGRLTAVLAGTRRIATDAAIIAAGIWSKDIARMAGARLPLEPGKGYSLDYPTQPFTVNGSVYLHDHRVAVTPFTGMTRLAGTMELGQRSDALNHRRISAIADAGRRSFTWAPGSAPFTASGGMRPLTPDGMPLLGAIPGFQNLTVASGHAMLGLTLAPVTGVAIAELVTEGRTSQNIAPFSPGRFR